MYTFTNIPNHPVITGKKKLPKYQKDTLAVKCKQYATLLLSDSLNELIYCCKLGLTPAPGSAE